MRYTALVFSLALAGLAPLPSAQAQVSVAIGMPGVNIGFNIGAYPAMTRVPGYPVYYAPQLAANYFFYDGLYWIFVDDEWYASDWYNGPWGRVGRDAVPLYVLRIPVRYYRRPPSYFGGWRSDSPPRWAEQWGGSWASGHSGWDQWDRRAMPLPAPLPTYQRQYPAQRYPQPAQQLNLHDKNYRFQPQEPVVQQHLEQRRTQVERAGPVSPPATMPSRDPRSPAGGQTGRPQEGPPRAAPAAQSPAQRVPATPPPAPRAAAPQPPTPRVPAAQPPPQRDAAPQSPPQRAPATQAPAQHAPAPQAPVQQAPARAPAAAPPAARVPMQAPAPAAAAQDNRGRGREQEKAREAPRDTGKDSGKEGARGNDKANEKDKERN